MFGIGGCEQVYGVPYFGGSDAGGKRAHQKRGCVAVLAEQKVSDWQMNAWTLRACDIVTL